MKSILINNPLDTGEYPANIDIGMIDALCNWIEYGLHPGGAIKSLLTGDLNTAKSQIHKLLLEPRLWNAHVKLFTSLPELFSKDNFDKWKGIRDIKDKIANTQGGEGFITTYDFKTQEFIIKLDENEQPLRLKDTEFTLFKKRGRTPFFKCFLLSSEQQL